MLLSCILILASDFNGGSSNGRTVDSDSTNLGSNPSPPANNEPRRKAGFFWADQDENLRFDKIAGSDFERRRYGGGPQGGGQDARSHPGPPAI